MPFSPSILVLKGGGVKGIAYVGALEVLEEYGFGFDHFVGTSAGAITAALLASGYATGELGIVLKKTDFESFKDSWLPVALLRLLLKKGLYRGQIFKVWMEDLLRRKFPEFQHSSEIKIRFNHIASRGKRLTVFASSRGHRFIAFDSGVITSSLSPANSQAYGVAFACRCSMAIPYFFTPESIEGNLVFDGGLQNNYPVSALLEHDPKVARSKDFIGLYLGPKNDVADLRLALLELFSIWQDGSNQADLNEFPDRTIVIDPRPVQTTDFSLSEKDICFLIAEGRASALGWLHHWSDQDRKPSIADVQDAKEIARRFRQNCVQERFRMLIVKLILTATMLGETRTELAHSIKKRSPDLPAILTMPNVRICLSIRSKAQPLCALRSLRF